MSDSEKAAAETAPNNGAIARHDELPPPHQGMSAGEYIRTRFSSLKPPMHKAPNPFRLIMMLNRTQWAFFAVSFIAWVSATR